jgi:hypothetical protein
MADTDNIDLLAGKIVELADKLSGPGAEAVIAGARISAMSTLSSGVIALVVAGGAAWLARKLFLAGGDRRNSDDYIGHKVGGAVLSIAAFIAALIGVWAFADPWTWTALNNPELWIAKRLLRI